MIVSFLRTVVAEFVGLFYVLRVQSIMKNVVMASAATFYWLVVFCLANVILLTFLRLKYWQKYVSTYIFRNDRLKCNNYI